MEAVRPNASGSLRRANERNDTLFKKTKSSILIHIIFEPFMINSSCHLNKKDMLLIKWRSNILALCAMAMILSTQGRSSQSYDKVSDRIFPERILSLTTLHAILINVCLFFATRKELLQADEIGNLYRGPTWIFHILSSLKIIEYVQHSIASRQYVQQGFHITQMTNFSVLFKVLSVLFVTLMILFISN